MRIQGVIGIVSVALLAAACSTGGLDNGADAVDGIKGRAVLTVLTRNGAKAAVSNLEAAARGAADLAADVAPSDASVFRAATTGMSVDTAVDTAVSNAVRSVEADPETREEATGTKKFHDVNFGVGFGGLFGGPTAIDETTVVTQGKKRILHVTKEHDSEPALLFEIHKFWSPRNDRQVGGQWGVGPYFAVQSGDGEAIDGAGLGLMFGWRPDRKSPSSFNLGVGAFLDTNVKSLGAGMVDGRALPRGETAVRYRETNEVRWMLAVSFSW